MEKVDFRIEKTYMSLYNAFTSLLEERHFEDITINDLCEHAMIRRTTFYKHFADKYDFFSFYLKKTCATFQNQLAPDILSEDVNTYFLHMSREMIYFIKKHLKFVENILNSNVFPMLLEILIEQIKNDILWGLRLISQNKGIATDNNKLETKAAYYTGGMMNVVYLWLKKGKEINEDLFIETMSKLLVKE